MKILYLKKINGIKVRMKNIYRCFTAYFSGFILLLFLSASAQAEDIVTRNIIEISPGIGYYNFDADRNLDDSTMAAMGLGLHFSRAWAFLLHYSSLNSRTEVNGVHQRVDMQKYHVDVHRFFNTEKKLRPYLVAGFGQMDLISQDINSNENMFNGGLGIYYRMTPSWSIRTDARMFVDTNNDYHDNALTLSFGYRFSGGEK